MDSLTTVFDNVQRFDGFMQIGWLQIPSSKQDELQQQYGRSQYKRACAVYFVTLHPSPSWRIVANALWKAGELGALEVVQKLYLKGEPCADSCRSEGRIGSLVAVM